ncbi:MAG: phosphonate ABC transporter substrate-binding protein [Candidatus Competibacterales bacterium]
MLRPVALALAIVMVPSTSTVAQETDVINFGIISTESTQALRQNFDPFLKDMEAALGIEIKPFFASDYAGIIEGMRFDRVDVAWFGNKSAMEAVDRAGGEIFAQTIKDDGSEGYYSLLIAHKDSDLETLEDVLQCDKSLTFGNGDPNSTSGFLVPSYYVFARNGVTPQECFKVVRNANHESNALAVANQQVDVATNNTESMYARLTKSKPEAAAQIKEIWRSPLIPSDPMVWRKNLPEDLKEDILYFFISYGRFGDMEKVKRERAVLAQLSDGWGPFLASSNAQLIPIRQLELFRDRTRIENDDSLSEAEKAEQIEAIDAQLAELEEQALVVGSIN